MTTKQKLEAKRDVLADDLERQIRYNHLHEDDIVELDIGFLSKAAYKYGYVYGIDSLASIIQILKEEQAEEKKKNIKNGLT